jgi:hypothetical protein
LKGRKYLIYLSFQGARRPLPWTFVLLFLCLSLQETRLDAEASTSEPFPDPTIVSIFPLGAQQGTEVKLEIRGEALDGAYAVLFDSAGLEAQVQEVAEIEPEVKESDDTSEDPAQEEEEKPPPIFRVAVRVAIDRSAPAGVHSFRLISPRGVSNALRFRVDEGVVVSEMETPHSSSRQAQPMAVPGVLNGRIRQHGELDYYVFEAFAAQELVFEIDLARHFEPRLALYQPTESWLDPDRPTRLPFDEERATDLMPLHPRFSYRVEPGRYLVEVGSLFGKGGPNCGYQLRILPAGLSDHAQTEAEWQERVFTRKIEPGWMDELWSRTVRLESEESDGPEGSSQTGSLVTSLDSPPPLMAEVPDQLFHMTEEEPNDLPEQALKFSVGTLIDGSIGAPGDRDTFKFEVEAGQQLAFEIETPEVKPPHFNPRLELRGEEGNELLTSIHMRHKTYGGAGIPSNYLKAAEPKVTYTFERSGHYYLEIRDITSRYGNSDYAYRLVVRPQIPHVGAFEVNPGDRINLIPGQARKVNIVTYQEEGFSGEVLFTFARLPQGVNVFPGAEVDGKKRPNEISEKEDSFVPDVQKTTLVLLADPDAPVTRMPQWLSLKARPIVGGQVGSPLTVAEIPLMVVKPDRVDLREE